MVLGSSSSSSEGEVFVAPHTDERTQREIFKVLRVSHEHSDAVDSDEEDDEEWVTEDEDEEALWDTNHEDEEDLESETDDEGENE
jgi:hypothetical protein